MLKKELDTLNKINQSECRSAHNTHTGFPNSGINATPRRDTPVPEPTILLPGQGNKIEVRGERKCEIATSHPSHPDPDRPSPDPGKLVLISHYSHKTTVDLKGVK